MSGVYQIPDTLLKNLANGEFKYSHWFLTIIDYFLAYYHVPIHPDHTKYLASEWKCHVYKFKVLCFSVKNAPFTLTDWVGQCDCISTLDDILVLASSFSQWYQDAQFVIDILIKLGFHIKI